MLLIIEKKINIEKKTISGIHLQTKERDEGDKLLNYTNNHAIECMIYHDIEFQIKSQLWSLRVNQMKG